MSREVFPKTAVLCVLTALLGLILAACAPQQVEVTRVVEQLVEQEVEVTRIVEQEVEVEVPVEVEVTRIVEALAQIETPEPEEAVEVTPEPEEAVDVTPEPEEAIDVTPDPEEAAEGPPPFVPSTEIIAEGLRSPRQMFYAPDGTLYITEAGTGGDSEILTGPESVIHSGLTAQISAVSPDGEQSVVLPALPSTTRGNNDTGYRGAHAIYVTDDAYWIGIGQGPENFGQMTLFYNVLEVNRDTWRIETLIDTAQAAADAGQPDPVAINSDPTDIAVAEDGTMFIADAGCNCLWNWTEESGLSSFHLWDIEDNPVPTGVAIGPDGSVYVSFLSGFPFEPESTRVEHYSADGELLETFGGLTMATDVLVTGDGTIYAVELAAGFGDAGFIPDSGRVVTVSADGITPVMENLPFPYALAQGPDGSLVVSIGSTFDPTGSGMVIAVE